VRAKALSTPEDPVDTPKDIRGFTVTNYNFWAGVANTSSIDHEIARDADGWLTLVVSTATDRPSTATAAHGVTWLDWGPYLDGQLIFRFLQRRAIETGRATARIAPYVPRAAHCSRRVFEDGGWEAALATDRYPTR
jgi:hypothetical protein